MNVKLIKDWTHPTGVIKKKGKSLEVTQGLYQELIEGGFIADPNKKKEKESLIKKDK